MHVQKKQVWQCCPLILKMLPAMLDSIALTRGTWAPYLEQVCGLEGLTLQNHLCQTPGNFLLLQTDLLSQIKQASVDIPRPHGITLVPKEGLLWQEDKIFVPNSLFILNIFHDHPLACHFGSQKTLDLVQHTFWWPDLGKNCKEYVNSCVWGLLKPLPVLDRLWKMISLDFIVKIPPSEGCTAIFVVDDRLSKMAIFFCL